MDQRGYPELTDTVHDGDGSKLGTIGHVFGRTSQGWSVKIDGMDEDTHEVKVVEVHGDEKNPDNVTEKRWELV